MRRLSHLLQYVFSTHDPLQSNVFVVAKNHTSLSVPGSGEFPIHSTHLPQPQVSQCNHNAYDS